VAALSPRATAAVVAAAMALGVLASCAKSHPTLPPPEPITEEPTAAPNVALGLPSAARESVSTCGEERWPVKTLSDPAVAQVDFTHVRKTSITLLNALTPHCTKLPARRTFAEEFVLIEVPAVITKIITEDDQDLHLVLADPENPKKTIIGELPDPMCPGTKNSPRKTEMIGALNMFTGMIGAGIRHDLIGRKVKVRGVGFYDFQHGQSGRSKPCLELHPVLYIKAVS
jgi:hypothetical protein